MSTARRGPSMLAWVGVAGLLGCSPPPPPEPVQIELVNATGLTVDANVYLSAGADGAAELFDPANLYVDYSPRPIPTLLAGETIRFDVACDDLAAIGVSLPVFVNPITITGGTSNDQVVLLREADFACGQLIRLTYSEDSGVFHVRAELP